MGDKSKPYTIRDNDIICDIASEKIEFINIGEVFIETDDEGNPVRINDSKNYALRIRTDKVKEESQADIGKKSKDAKSTQRKNYSDIRKLDDIWSRPGIYMFVSKKEGNNVEIKYIGRASGKILKRVKGHLCPTGETQSTNKRINRKLFESIKNEERIFLYFHERENMETELQRKLEPKYTLKMSGDTNSISDN